jgi:hypothetical protein
MRAHSPPGPPPLPRRRALEFSDYLGHEIMFSDVGFVASNGAHVVTTTGLAPQLTCLQIPFPEVFTRSSDAKDYLKGGAFSALSGLVPILTFGLFVLLLRRLHAYCFGSWLWSPRAMFRLSRVQLSIFFRLLHYGNALGVKPYSGSRFPCPELSAVE